MPFSHENTSYDCRIIHSPIFTRIFFSWFKVNFQLFCLLLFCSWIPVTFNSEGCFSFSSMVSASKVLTSFQVIHCQLPWWLPSISSTQMSSVFILSQSHPQQIHILHLVTTQICSASRRTYSKICLLFSPSFILSLSFPFPSLLPLPDLSAFSFSFSKTSSPWSWPGHLLHYLNWFHWVHRSLDVVIGDFSSPTPAILAAMSLKSALTFHSYWFFCPICSSFLLICCALTHTHSCF